MLDQATVTCDIFQPADQHELEEHYGVERGMPCVAVDGAGLLTQKFPIEQLAQPAIEIMAWHALGETKLRDDFVGELLVALHNPLTYRHLTGYFCNRHA